MVKEPKPTTEKQKKKEQVKRQDKLKPLYDLIVSGNKPEGTVFYHLEDIAGWIKEQPFVKVGFPFINNRGNKRHHHGRRLGII